MIKKFDIELISRIIEPFNIKMELSKFFCGYKLNDNSYYSFFFSFHKNDVLLFTFRFNQKSSSNTRIYVTYNNIDLIRAIIDAILHENILDRRIYEAYIYEENNINEKREIESSLSQKTIEALNCHWKLPGLTVLPDPNGINISKLNISYRLMNALYRYDIVTIKQLMDLDPLAMEKMRLLGRKSYKEALNIKSQLQSNHNYKRSTDRVCLYKHSDEIKLNSNIFNITEDDYTNNNQDYDSLKDYQLKGMKIINKIRDVIIRSDLTNREKDIILKYSNIDGSSNNITLQEIGNNYGITRERIRQILKKTQRKLRKYRQDIIPVFNEIIGEKQFSYLIEGIVKQRSYRTLNFVLLMVLDNKDYEIIKQTLDNCIMLASNNVQCSKSNPKRYYNAGAKWELREDQQLIEEFIMGIDIPETAKIHGRTRGAIKKRLIKLHLMD